MKMKDYQKPTIKVVMLQHQCNILAASPQTTKAEDFTWDEE